MSLTCRQILPWQRTKNSLQSRVLWILLSINHSQSNIVWVYNVSDYTRDFGTHPIVDMLCGDYGLCSHLTSVVWDSKVNMYTYHIYIYIISIGIRWLLGVVIDISTHMNACAGFHRDDLRACTRFTLEIFWDFLDIFAKSYPIRRNTFDIINENGTHGKNISNVLVTTMPVYGKTLLGCRAFTNILITTAIFFTQSNSPN